MKEPEVVESFEGSIRRRLMVAEETNTVEDEWVAFRDKVVKAAEDQIGKKA